MKKELSQKERKEATSLNFAAHKEWQMPRIQVQPRAHYPWSARNDSVILPITKAHLQCRGSNLNPPIFHRVDETLFDCNGASEHTLPVCDGKESVPDELIEVLNYIQNATGRPLLITAGHRCPKHQRYINPSFKAQFSKHLIAAEVTFYLKGSEDAPGQIIDLIKDFYKSHPKLKDDKRYTKFERYEKSDTDVSTPPWYNHELFIKLYQSHEGRDLDNAHPFPYVSIQMRFNRKGERVRYTHEVALQSVQTK